MRIATFNAASLISQKRKKWLRDLVMVERLDVICLQETKISTVEQERDLINYFKDAFWCYHASATGFSAGVAIMVKKNGRVTKVVDCELDQTGRISVVDCVIDNEIVRVISVYAPNETQRRAGFFKELRHFVDVPSKIIMCGDFNCVEGAKDCTYRLQKQDRSAQELKRLTRDFDLVDAASCKRTHGPVYTHWQGSSHARLDRIYVSGEINLQHARYENTPVAFSDHTLVVLQLQGKMRAPRSARHDERLWKLNESFCEEEPFVTRVHAMLDEFEENTIDAISWERFKQEVKNFAMQYGRSKAAEKSQQMKHLMRTLSDLLTAESRAPGAFAEEIKTTKNTILGMMKDRYIGAMVRAREEVVLRDEEPTKIFLRKERQRAKDNRIDKIAGHGIIYEGEQQVQDAFVAAYRQLFSGATGANGEDVNDFAGELPIIDEATRKMNNEAITELDILAAIKTLSKNKAPGPDGIGSKFYKTFALKLGRILEKVFQDIHKRGLLPPSMRKAHTVLIRKKQNQGSVPGVADFRPISLLCTDYKILAKTLALRLDRGLKDVVGIHQTYGIKRRCISRNLHVMRTVCEAAAGWGRPLAVVQIDLSQAFDRVLHAFLFALLKRCKVGSYIERWITTCYRDINTHLIINGRRGPAIDIKTSVRQGCPLSPILFSLYIEPLCRKLLNTTTIKGLCMGREEIKVMAYADDIALICTSQLQVIEAFEVVKRFTQVSGAKVNILKSEGAWLGNWRTTPSTFLGMKWTQEITSYLGVPLVLETTSAQTWGKKLTTLQGKLTSWSGRQLSLLNRTYICNTVSYPSALYWMQCLRCDAVTLNRIHRIWATFIWQSSFERMRRTNLFLCLEEGGFGLVNAMLKKMVQRLQFFRRRKDDFLEAAVQELGAAHLKKWVVSTGRQIKTSRVPSFYKEVAEALTFFEARYSWEYLQTTKVKKIYWDTLTAMLSPAPYRSINDPQKGRDVLRRVRKLPVPTSSKDFFTKLHCEVLPVKQWLQGKGFFVPWTMNCPFCVELETLQHVFITCKGAMYFWADLRLHTSVEIDPDWHAIKYLVLRGKEIDDVLAVLVVLGLHSIWRARVDYVECKEEIHPAWWHFQNKLRWTLSVVNRTTTEKVRWRDLEKRILGPNSLLVT